MSLTAADMITRYARRGLAVLPLHQPYRDGCSCGWEGCPAKAKHPRLGLAHPKGDPLRATWKGECGRPGHGVHDATTDLDQIAEWFARWPGANWGIEPPPGYVILDIDPRNGGDQSFAALEAEHGPIPPTWRVATGSGGTHLWLRHTGPSRGKIAKGIDVKKAGGYVVAPPSLHMAGERYRWNTPRRAHGADAAYRPEWVRKLLDPPPLPRAQTNTMPRGDALDALIRFVQESPEGERNSRLYWAACRAHGSDHDVAPLVQAAVDLGLPHHEVEATVRSAGYAPDRTTTTPLTQPGRRRGA